MLTAIAVAQTVATIAEICAPTKTAYWVYLVAVNANAIKSLQ